jgi:hypothetical protein
MSDEKGYNGWKNYETWVTALWIDTDQCSYTESRDLIRGCTEVHEAADILKKWIEDTNPLNDQASLFSDLLSAALSEVDWFEIASNYMLEVVEGLRDEIKSWDRKDADELRDLLIEFTTLKARLERDISIADIDPADIPTYSFPADMDTMGRWAIDSYGNILEGESWSDEDLRVVYPDEGEI